MTKWFVRGSSGQRSSAASEWATALSMSCCQRRGELRRKKKKDPAGGGIASIEIPSTASVRRYHDRMGRDGTKGHGSEKEEQKSEEDRRLPKISCVFILPMNPYSLRISWAGAY